MINKNDDRLGESEIKSFLDKGLMIEVGLEVIMNITAKSHHKVINITLAFCLLFVSLLLD